MKKAKTYGLTHIAMAVKDLDQTLAFYQKVFEVEVMYYKDDFLQVRTPGANDIIVFEKKKADYGQTGGIAHFGFRLRSAKDIHEMAQIESKRREEQLLTRENLFLVNLIFSLRIRMDMKLKYATS